METNSKSNPSFVDELQAVYQAGSIPEKIKLILADFYKTYKKELTEADLASNKPDELFLKLLTLVKKELASPSHFEPYHEQVRAPFDYYAFGLDLLKPLVDIEHSTTLGLDHLKEVDRHIKNGHNVVLLANHQIEADPQAISILLEKTYPELATSMIFVAGERVLTDPLAVPFSLGRNLLCIYSKRYIDNPPEMKHQKQLHNKKTMEKMSELLKAGGKCIYVAPSGGRDRPNENGDIVVAPFDPQSIEMFYLMARRAKTPTFFYPLALATYSLLPPPQTIQVELGELRTTNRGAIHLALGPQIDMEHFPGSDTTNKHEQRKVRAEYIYHLVKQEYAKFS